MGWYSIKPDESAQPPGNAADQPASVLVQSCCYLQLGRKVGRPLDRDGQGRTLRVVYFAMLGGSSSSLSASSLADCPWPDVGASSNSPTTRCSGPPRGWDFCRCPVWICGVRPTIWLSPRRAREVTCFNTLSKCKGRFAAAALVARSRVWLRLEDPSARAVLGISSLHGRRPWPSARLRQRPHRLVSKAWRSPSFGRPCWSTDPLCSLRAVPSSPPSPPASWPWGVACSFTGVNRRSDRLPYRSIRVARQSLA